MGTLRTIRLGIIGVLAFAVGVAAPPPSSSAGESTLTITWTTHTETLADGRTFHVRAPGCSPADAAGCVEFLGRRRPLVVFLHGAYGVEDRDSAAAWLDGMGVWSRDTIFAFGVSKDGTRMWDAGICCTSTTVDDVGYLRRLVDRVAARWSVDRARVGATGFSNGGMLALRAICERPDVFAAVVSLSGSYDGDCGLAQVRIGQWHGAEDKTVPLNGGTVTIVGKPRTFPPVDALSQRMVRGSLYHLRVLPARGHGMSWTDYRQSTRWLLTQLG